MNITLAVIGFVFLGAAAVGGGLKAFNIEVPQILDSSRRQLLLAGVGAAAVAAAFVAPRINPSTPPSSPPSTQLTSTSATSPGTSVSPKNSALSTPASNSPKFLADLPIASGDMPQTGLVNIGGQSFPESLYYNNIVRIPPNYSTHFALTRHWTIFIASVGIQPDPTDQLAPNGSCTRDAGSTFEVLVDQTRVLEGDVPCGRTQKISVSVAGAHDLNLVFNLNIVGATGDFTWANAHLK